MSLENMTEDERNSAALKRLFAHPDVGLEAKRLYKKITPDAKFTDLETDDKLKAQRAETDKEIGDLREKLQMQEISSRRKENHEMIRAAGLDPVAVEKVMTDEKIASYDTAVKYVQAQNANVRPSAANVTPIQMPDNVKDIQKNPAMWARTKAFEAINELKAKRGF